MFEILPHQRTESAMPEARAVGYRLLDEDELGLAYPEFELGAVPPFGGPAERTIVDVRLACRPGVVIEAGTHVLSLKLPADDLVAAADADVADVADA